MKLTRTVLALTAGALAPALLLATPALATAAPVKASVTAPAGAALGSDTENAAAIAKILADPASGKSVIREANAALSGTPADRVAFLTTGYAKAQDEDNKVTILRILFGKPGKSVTREANKALDGTPADRVAFLATGLAKAQDEDNKVAILRILHTNPATGKGVKREANKALDGTPADRAAFLKTGLRLAQAEDDRVDVVRILARPGISDALYAECQRLLNGSTPEELRYFITVGQYQF
ncbi:ALF repeat-containing protein [Streptomyces virginiae]|uniref:ALF repeat-containing protein n=1 Tax=Streptomyces virginiae TaxID=1961 RepID=UPI00224D2FC5|nr:ALF repeat-containing protein [Streptomyces virginiae]MCX4962872.1 ALF repeat-containing protein [Streptomyces virginiae]